MGEKSIAQGQGPNALGDEFRGRQNQDQPQAKAGHDGDQRRQDLTRDGPGPELPGKGDPQDGRDSG